MPQPIELPDPDSVADLASVPDVVIYDGQCNFCIRQVRILRRLDIGGKRLAFLSLHDDRVSERYPDLSHDDLMARMYVIDGSGYGSRRQRSGQVSLASATHSLASNAAVAFARHRRPMAMDVQPGSQTTV